MPIAIPPGTTDCHAHVFGPNAQFPYDPHRTYTPPEALAPEYLAFHQAVGVDRGVLVQPSVYGTDNRAMVAALDRLGPHYRGVAVVREDEPEASLHGLHRAGVRGVRFNLVQGSKMRLSENMEDLGRRIADIGWHIQVHAEAHRFAELAERLKNLPVRVVCDHYASCAAADGTRHPAFGNLLRLLDSGRIWVKLSGPYIVSRERPPYPDVTPMARALLAHRPDRLVWGTDWPHPMAKDDPPTVEHQRSMLDAWFPDSATRRQVLVDNPASLYGFSS
jgi:predicted TIM-barrel fold metal-dependent hydrolase